MAKTGRNPTVDFNGRLRKILHRALELFTAHHDWRRLRERARTHHQHFRSLNATTTPTFLNFRLPRFWTTLQNEALLFFQITRHYRQHLVEGSCGDIIQLPQTPLHAGILLSRTTVVSMREGNSRCHQMAHSTVADHDRRAIMKGENDDGGT